MVKFGEFHIVNLLYVEDYCSKLIYSLFVNEGVHGLRYCIKGRTCLAEFEN